MPDYLHDDAISFEDMNSGKVDLMAWLAKHGKDVTRPAIDKVVQHLKGQGVQKFAAIGYCFGALRPSLYGVESTLDRAPHAGQRTDSPNSRRWPLRDRPRRRLDRLGRRRRSPFPPRRPQGHSRPQQLVRSLPLVERRRRLHVQQGEAGRSPRDHQGQRQAKDGR